MKKLIIFLAFIIANFCTVNADTVTMRLTGVNSAQQGGYAVGTATGTVNGTPITMVCDDFAHHVSVGQTWTATISTFADLSSARYASLPGAVAKYQQAAWLFDQFAVNPTATGDNNALRQTNIKVLACPDDQSAAGVNGGLSYVANNGYLLAGSTSGNRWTAGGLDWNATFPTNFAGSPQFQFPTEDADPADADAHRDTGVFWPSFGTATTGREAQKNSHSVDGIYDGGGQTIMFSENVNAGSTGWADPTWYNIGFVYIVDSVPLTAAPANGATTTNSFRYPQAGTTSGNKNNLPNRLKSGPEAGATADGAFSAAPNSGHPGGVNVAYADGSVGFLTDTIDETVYARLISPAGARNRLSATGIAGQDPLSDNSF